MFQHFDSNSYLWLMPLLLLILAPVTFTLLGFLLRLTRTFFFTSTRIGKEKRNHPRFIPYEGTFAEIKAGNSTCTGLVCDISRMGIRLNHLPDKLLNKMDKLTVVIRGYGVDHSLLVRPKWVAETESGKLMGAEIDTPPPGWNQFLLQTERISPSQPIG